MSPCIAPPFWNIFENFFNKKFLDLQLKYTLNSAKQSENFNFLASRPCLLKHNCVRDLPLSYTCYAKGIIILLSRPLKFSESKTFFIVLSRFLNFTCCFAFMTADLCQKIKVNSSVLFYWYIMFFDVPKVLILRGKFKRLKCCFTLKNPKYISAFIWNVNLEAISETNGYTVSAWSIWS